MAQVEKKKKCPLGLKTDSNNPVPLKSIKVDVNITGCVAEVTSNLTYFNEEEDPVEAAFTFPVDDGSAVFQFEAEIDGRHIVAEIQEKEQAQLTYQDAIDQNKTAMLLKEDDSAGDIFSCMLGNLPPESEASLLMKYVIELPQEADGRLKFTLPTILNPRYSPDCGCKIAAEDATYVLLSKVPYRFSLSASVRGYHKVTSVTSDRLKLYVEYGQNNEDAKVTIDDAFKFDHDLCLLVQYERPYLPQVVLETGNPDAEGLLKNDMLMVSFHPDLQTGEYILVIDRSGSMIGSKINNAKEALFLFLKSLPSGCYFNVVSFGFSDDFLFPEGSKKYSKQSLEEATNLYRRMKADMGGTEILRPLEKIFKNKLIAGHPRSVILITDGEVRNTDQVIALVRKEAQSSETRVFSLGIGYGASSSLINGLANSGRGKAEFIAGGDRIQAKVISLLECAMQPAIMDITLDWKLPEGVKPITIPTEPPTSISAGERLTLFAVLQGLDEQKEYKPSSVTLKGKRHNKDVSYSMTFVLCKPEEVNKSAPIHRLATKTQIKHLQGQESAYDFKVTGELRQEIINLSRHGNIISKYAAFVAVDTKGQKVEGKSLQRPCPVPFLFYEYTDLFYSDWSYDIDGDMYGDMYENIDRVMVRGEEMDNLEEKAEILAMSRSAFGQKAQGKSHMFGRFFSSLKNIITRRAPTHKDYEDRNIATCSPIHNEYENCHVSTCSPIENEYENCKVSTGSSMEDVYCESMYEPLPGYKNGIGPTHKEYEDSNIAICSPIDDEYESCDVPTGSSRVDVYCKSMYDSLPLYKTRENESRNVDACRPKANAYENDNKMLSVIALQQLHGEWEISEELLHLLGIQKSNIRKHKFSKDSTVVCTVIALCWLRKHFSRRKDEWKMIEMKALTWLASQNLPLPTEAIIQQATLALWP